MDEAGTAMGFSSLTLLLDIEKFHDSASLVLLLRIARRMGYPAALISLEVQLFLAPRYPQQRS
eukprot:8653053-Pyramimonas_sp.AAC.1